MIRRKSDAIRQLKTCHYHEQFLHERDNQALHEQRQAADPQHDPWSPCWCCCDDCLDLAWKHLPRKGVWWERSASGGLLLKRETSAESPGSPETRRS